MSISDSDLLTFIKSRGVPESEARGVLDEAKRRVAEARK